MLDFIAIDFETANSRRGSPCAVGLVRVRDGRIVDEQRWLIRPPREVDFFDSFNIGIHGITAADVADPPSWSDVVPRRRNRSDFLACLGDYRAPVAASTSRGTVRAATDVDSAPRPRICHGRKTTTQQCSTDGCTHLAAFRTHGRSAWCDEHIAHIQREGGVERLEPFTHPEDWQLTRCLACGIACHYRFAYTLKKNGYGEPTCRACFLRQWSHHARALQGAHADTRVVPAGEAEATAAAAGFDYLGPLTDPSLPDDPHYTRCRRCGKLAAQRLSDISFGCACRERRR